VATLVDLTGQLFWVARYLTATLKTLPNAPVTAWFLFDNGSLRPVSTLSLRRLASLLSDHLGLPVQPVSLLHSSQVAAEELGGVAARLLEPALVAFFEQNPAGEAVLMPLFFGPSAALTEYVPARVAAVRARFPQARVRLAPWLVHTAETDTRVAGILADQVRATAQARGWGRPRVILCDHGTPQPAVAEVRNHLGAQLRVLLAQEIAGLAVASMERREGAAYDFNEPLLASVLSTPPFDGGPVVIALQFLSPGRHAGPGGDIAQICQAAEADHPGLQTQMTEPIASDVRLVELLAERLAQATAL
jgi:sirohydrochlorin ferrochelatase